jgi:hypothetical protein
MTGGNGKDAAIQHASLKFCGYFTGLDFASR